MACSKPLTGFLCSDGSLVFSELKGDVIKSLSLPCNHCTLCRVSRAREISTRLIHESYLHGNSMCATFTVAPEHLDPLGSVSKRDAQLLVKRVREKSLRERGALLRHDLISEYSPGLKRPHYHACLFGYWPPDAVASHQSQAGNQEYTSAELTALWGKGRVTFQQFSTGGAAYCARHQSWKLTGRPGDDFLAVRNSSGDLVGRRAPEFRLCSRRPGLGAGFFDRHGAQMLAYDFTVIDGKRVPLPKYYDRLAKRVNPDRVSELKAQRELKGIAQSLEQFPARLEARECVALARLRTDKRGGIDG